MGKKPHPINIVQHPCLFKCIFCEHTVYYPPEKNPSTKLHPNTEVQGMYMGLSLCSVPLKTISPQFTQVLYLQPGPIFQLWFQLQFSSAKSRRFQGLFWPVRCPSSIPYAGLPHGSWQQGTLQCQQHTAGPQSDSYLSCHLTHASPKFRQPLSLCYYSQESRSVLSLDHYKEYNTTCKTL